MPVLGTRPEHEAVCRHRLPDQTSFDDVAARLQAGAEERVRGATEPEPSLRRGIHQRLALGELDTERLLAEDRLSRHQGRPGHGTVCLGMGEVDHRVDLVVGKERVERSYPGNVISRRQLGGSIRHAVGTGHQIDEVDFVEGRGVCRRDHATSDDPDTFHWRA